MAKFKCFCTEVLRKTTNSFLINSLLDFHENHRFAWNLKFHTLFTRLSPKSGAQHSNSQHRLFNFMPGLLVHHSNLA
jgi:hypothetical protein